MKSPLNPDILAFKLQKLGATSDAPLPYDITDVCDDTREVQPGFVFVLRPGAQELSQERARELIENAVNKGASAILCDQKYKSTLKIPCITLPDPETKLAVIARIFYGNPSLFMKVIGVTGTNGKTTTTYLLESIGQKLGLRMGVIGTVCHRYPGYSETSINTTPGTLKLYRLLAGMKAARTECVAMEVSSHGLAQGRIENLAFDAAIWTNLGTDHLDFHKTIENYAQTKQLLFNRVLPSSYAQGKFPFAIYNAADEQVCDYIEQAYSSSDWGGRRLSFANAPYSTGFDAPSLQVFDVSRINRKWHGKIAWRNQVYPFQFGLPGRYNIDNVLGAMSAFLAMGFEIERILDAIQEVAQIPGRLEALDAVGCAHTLVDFAHTPEALESALISVAEDLTKEAELWVVFGAGGDRDPSKRPKMGAIAAKYANHIVITNDNPRTENPQTILDQILAGIPENKRDMCFVQPDRREAIFHALKCAKPCDIVLIAGKGHEDYQILGTTKYPFDDRDVVKDFWKDFRKP